MSGSIGGGGVGVSGGFGSRGEEGPFEVEYLKNLPPCHPHLVEAIVTQIKSQGLFDEFRKTCLADIDTKPSYLNLKQRVEGYVSAFLKRQQWSSVLQKNQLRETLRKDINESGLLKTGLDHLVDQLVFSRVERFIRPKVQTEIADFLGISETPPQPIAASHGVPVAVPPPNFSMPPPNYVCPPPGLPPFPPVPPPPDVAGLMMMSQGGLMGDNNRTRLEHEGAVGDPRPPEPPSPHGSDYSVDMSDCSMVGRDEVVGDIGDFVNSSRAPVPGTASTNAGSNHYSRDSSLTGVGEDETEVVQESMVLLIEGEDISNSPLSNDFLEDDDQTDSTGDPTQQPPDIKRGAINPSEVESNSLSTTMVMINQDEQLFVAATNQETVESTPVHRDPPVASSASTNEDEELGNGKRPDSTFEELSDGGESVLTAGEEEGEATPVEDEPDNEVIPSSPPSNRRSLNQRPFSRNGDESCGEARTDFRGLFPVGNMIAPKHEPVPPGVDYSHGVMPPSPYTDGNNTADDNSRMVIDEGTVASSLMVQNKLMQEDNMELVSDEELNDVEGEGDTVGSVTPTIDEQEEQELQQPNTAESAENPYHMTVATVAARTRDQSAKADLGPPGCISDTTDARSDVCRTETALEGTEAPRPVAVAESKTVPKTTLFCADAPNSFSPTRSTQSPSHMSDGSVKHIEARETTPQFPRSPQKSQEEDDNMRPKQLLSLMQSRTDPALSSPEQSSSSRPVDVDLMPTTPPRPPSVAPPKQKAEGGAPSGPPSPTIEGTHDGCYSTVRLGFGEEVVSSEGSIGTATEDDCSTRIEAVPTTQPADEDTRPPGTSDLDSNEFVRLSGEERGETPVEDEPLLEATEITTERTTEATGHPSEHVVESMECDPLGELAVNANIVPLDCPDPSNESPVFSVRSPKIESDVEENLQKRASVFEAESFVAQPMSPSEDKDESEVPAQDIDNADEKASQKEDSDSQKKVENSNYLGHHKTASNSSRHSSDRSVRQPGHASCSVSLPPRRNSGHHSDIKDKESRDRSEKNDDRSKRLSSSSSSSSSSSGGSAGAGSADHKEREKEKDRDGGHRSHRSDRDKDSKRDSNNSEKDKERETNSRVRDKDRSDKEKDNRESKELRRDHKEGKKQRHNTSSSFSSRPHHHHHDSRRESDRNRGRRHHDDERDRKRSSEFEKYKHEGSSRRERSEVEDSKNRSDHSKVSKTSVSEGKHSPTNKETQESKLQDKDTKTTDVSIESERTVVTASTILTTKEKNVCDKTMKSSDDEAIHAVDVQSLPSNNDKLKAFPRTADVESSVLTEKQGNEEMSTKKELLKDQEDKRFQLKINNDTSILDIEVLENEDDTEENEGKSENDEVTKTSKLFLETTSEREQIITETQQHDHVSISTMDNKVAQKRVSEPLEHDEISPKKQRIPQEVVHFDEAANATDSSDNREDQLVINETEDQPDDDDESRDLEIDLEAPAPSRKRRRKTSLDTTGTGAGRSKRGRKASTTSPDKGRPQLQDNNNGASKGECSPVQVPGGPAKRGRRRSSAASGGQLNQLGGLQKDSKTTPAEDTPLLEATPDPPVSSRGRQRKINPKYIDDGDVAAMFYRKKR